MAKLAQGLDGESFGRDNNKGMGAPAVRSQLVLLQGEWPVAESMLLSHGKVGTLTGYHSRLGLPPGYLLSKSVTGML